MTNMELNNTTYDIELEKLYKPENFENFDEYSVAVAEETMDACLGIWDEYCDKYKE